MKFEDIFKKKVQIDTSTPISLDRIIEALSEAKIRGEDVYYDWCLDGKNVRLYSRNIEPDAAYKQVYGITRTEYREKIDAQKRESNKIMFRAKSLKDHIPELLEQGKAMIYPERYEEWEEFVSSSFEGMYKGLEVDATLTIMKELATDRSIEEVLSIIENDPFASEYDRISNYVFQFSARGPEFLEETVPQKLLTPKIRSDIEAKKRENATLAQKHGKVYTKKQKL